MPPPIASLTTCCTSNRAVAFRAYEVDLYWPHIAPHLERFARECRTASAEDIRADVKAALKQLWGYYRGDCLLGVAVTETFPTLRGQICRIWAAAGSEAEGGEILEVFAEIEKWARELGCAVIEIRGRLGWKRVLPGFQQVAVILEKEL